MDGGVVATVCKGIPTRREGHTMDPPTAAKFTVDFGKPYGLQKRMCVSSPGTILILWGSTTTITTTTTTTTTTAAAATTVLLVLLFCYPHQDHHFSSPYFYSY